MKMYFQLNNFILKCPLFLASNIFNTFKRKLIKIILLNFFATNSTNFYYKISLTLEDFVSRVAYLSPQRIQVLNFYNKNVHSIKIVTKCKIVQIF